MKINKIIIHEIIKDLNTTNASVFLTDKLLDGNNDSIIKIIDSLEKSFTKKTLKRARFSDDGFKEDFKDFNSYDLLEISKILTTKLKNNIQGISQAKGGYLLFTEFEKTHNFLAIFLIRNTDGTKLKQSGNSWDLASTQYLDVEHFAMGAKINLSKLGSNSDDRYISLVKGNTEISDYFEKWIGLDDTKQESKDSEALYEISNMIELPSGMDDRDEFLKKIFDYARGRPSKIVNLKELSNYLYSNEHYISDYCNENNFDIDGEFKLTGKNLNKFHKVFIKADDIEMSTPRSSFNRDKIRVENGKVIINSISFVEEINKIFRNDD